MSILIYCDLTALVFVHHFPEHLDVLLSYWCTRACHQFYYLFQFILCECP